MKYHIRSVSGIGGVAKSLEMHGRKKSDQPHTEAELTNLQRKTDLYSRTVTAVMTKKKSRDFSEDSFELTAKVLKSNPDFYSIWNFRKEILVSMLPELSVSGQKNHLRLANDEVRDKELKLSEDCIRKNPKSCMSITFILQRGPTQPLY